MKNEPLYSLIINMYQSHDTYFDKGVAQFIFNSLGKDKLKTQVVPTRNLHNFEIYTNLWGSLLAYNKAYSKNKTQEDNYSKQQINIVEVWKTLFNEIDKTLITDPVYTLVKKNGSQKRNEYKIGINGLLAINNIVEWFEMYETNPSKYALTKEESFAVCYDFLEEKQDYHLYNIDNKTNLVSFLINELPKHLEQIQKEMHKNDDEFTNKLLSSESIKHLIKASDPEDVCKIFTSNSLKAIYKKASIKENMKFTPHLLSNLLPIASPQEWIKACSDDGKLDIFKFFSKLINNTTGFTATETQNLLKTRGQSYDHRKKHTKSWGTSTEIAEIIDYFAEEIKALNLSEKDRTLWFTIAMGSPEKSLFKKSLELLAMPERNTDDDTISYMYSNWFDKIDNNKKGEKKATWEDVMREHYRDELANKLEVKEPKKRSVKL